MQKKNESQIDLVWLIKYFSVRWKFIAKYVGVCVVLAVIINFCKDKEYTVETSLLPITSGSASMGNLSNLASMAGVKIGGSNGSSIEIDPSIYNDVIQSTPTKLKLMDIPLYWEQPDTCERSLYEQFKADTIMTFAKYLKDYTIGLPGTIKNKLAPPLRLVADIPSDEDDITAKMRPISLDPARLKAVTWLEDQIDVEYDDNIGIVYITVRGQNPQQVCQLAIAVIETLQTSITLFKTKDARTTLNFIQERYDETMHEYEAMRKAYYEYTDTHRDYVEERSDIRKQKLQDAFNMQYSLLQTLQQSLEDAKINLMAQTPAFSIVEPVVVPNKKSSPKLLSHIVAGILLGLLSIIGFYIVRLGYWQVFDRKKYYEIYEQYAIKDEQ